MKLLDQFGREVQPSRCGFVPSQPPRPKPAPKNEYQADAIASTTIPKETDDPE